MTQFNRQSTKQMSTNVSDHNTDHNTDRKIIYGLIDNWERTCNESSMVHTIFTRMLLKFVDSQLNDPELHDFLFGINDPIGVFMKTNRPGDQNGVSTPVCAGFVKDLTNMVYVINKYYLIYGMPGNMSPK